MTNLLCDPYDGPLTANVALEARKVLGVGVGVRMRVRVRVRGRSRDRLRLRMRVKVRVRVIADVALEP